METTVEERKRAHAQTYRVVEDHVSVVRFELQRLRNEGALVDINIHGLSMLSAGISWEELGIGELDVRRSRFSKGQKLLFPRDIAGPLLSIDRRIRTLLEKYSYKVTGFIPYRWVPVGAYFTWLEKHNELAQEFEEAKQTLLDTYEESRKALAHDFREIAHSSYSSLEANGEVAQTREQFVQHVIDVVLSKMPSEERIQAEIRVEYRTAILEDSADIQARLAAYEQEKIEIERARASQHAEWEKQHTVTEGERLKRQRMIEMHRMELEKAREQLQNMRSPWDEVVGAFHQQIHDEVLAILGIIKDRGFIPHQTVKRIKGLREMYDILAVQQDNQIEEALNQIESAMQVQAAKKTRSAAPHDAHLVGQALDELVEAVAEGRGNATRVNEWTALELD